MTVEDLLAESSSDDEDLEAKYGVKKQAKPQVDPYKKKTSAPEDARIKKMLLGSTNYKAPKQARMEEDDNPFKNLE